MISFIPSIFSVQPLPSPGEAQQTSGLQPPSKDSEAADVCVHDQKFAKQKRTKASKHVFHDRQPSYGRASKSGVLLLWGPLVLFLALCAEAWEKLLKRSRTKEKRFAEVGAHPLLDDKTD